MDGVGCYFHEKLIMSVVSVLLIDGINSCVASAHFRNRLQKNRSPSIIPISLLCDTPVSNAWNSKALPPRSAISLNLGDT